MSAFSSNNRPRKSNSRYVTTRSGKSLRIHQSIGEKWKGLREGKNLRKVQRMQGLPKSRLKRMVWRMQPSHLKEYWWSRDGAIMALKVGGIGVLAIFILMLATFAFFRKDLASIKNLGGNLDGSISYYDRTGKILLFQDYNAVKRVPVQSNEINNYMKEATVATEDRGFYSEPGFSIRGVARAAVDDLIHHGAVQGGSTITEQLVKMTENWSLQRTLPTKIKELILAVDLDRTYSKDDILTAYLNVAPYGGVDYGVQVAASDYFHTDAAHLTLPQAAFLAAIPNSPSYYSPYGPYYNAQALQDRYKYVLQSMVDTHYITQAQADAASQVAVFDKTAKVFPQQTKYAGIKDPYFVLAAKNQLDAEFLHPNGNNGSSEVGGWKVITTMNVTLQNLANKVTADNLPNVERYGGDEEAFAAEDVKTGQMVALVGGVNFTNSTYGQINYAQWPISPGSSFKPYDYSTFINNNNAGAGSVLYDTVAPLPGYPCTNKALPLNGGNCLEDYDFTSPGPETLRYALGGSRNIPAVKAMLEADPNDKSALRTDSVNKVIDTADALMDAPGAYNCFSDAQMTQTTQCYGSSALGDGAFLHLDQHVNGLASLARMGVAIPQTYILSIQDSNNNSIYKWTQPKGTQVIQPDAAYIVDNMAADPRASYLPGNCTTGSDATCSPLSAGGYKFQRIDGWNNAVKTGTTGDSYDGLMTSWNTQYAAAAWVGYHTRNVALSTFMEVLTEPITRPWMEGALTALNEKPVNWQQPSDIQTLPAYVLNHKISANGEQVPSQSTDIFPSWYKPRTAAASSSTIDKVSGLLATDCTPADAKETLSGSASANVFSVDAFYGAGFSGSTPTGQDNVHSCSDASPNFNSPGHFYVTPSANGSVQLDAQAEAGTHPLTGGKFGGTISFTINGSPISGCPNSCSFAMNSAGAVLKTFTYTGPSGPFTVIATVTDSVLYQATDSYKASFTKSAQPLIINTATKTNASWSGGQPGTTYTLTDTTTGDTLCSTTTVSCSYQPPGSLSTNKGDTVQLTDSSNDTPATKQIN